MASKTNLLLLLAAVAIGACDGAASSCADKCSGISSRFKFKQGSSYVYNYQSKNKVELTGNSKNAPALQLQAKVTISVLGRCEYTLQLSDVKFNGPPASQTGFDLAQDLVKYPLVFAYDNGEVRHVCPSEQEANDALNIKRGILSTFQLANDFDAEDAYETDVTGRCPVKNTVVQVQGKTVVTKYKNLVSCHQHNYRYSSIHHVPYRVSSAIQNMPAAKVEQTCTYALEQNVLKEASCVETHELQIGRNFQNTGGVTATVESKLTFAQEGKSGPATPVGPKKSLLFNDKPFIYPHSKDAVGKARNLIKNLLDTAAKEVRPESPADFQELVYLLKASSAQDLRLLAKEAKSNNAKSKRIFVDAVAQCGTAACVTLLSEMLTPKTHPDMPALSRVEKALVLVNLALTAHPTAEAVGVVADVLDQLPENGLLAATSLVDNFIKLHEDALDKKEVKTFIDKYVGLLPKLSPTTDATKSRKTIETLRAFGNLGGVANALNERLAFLDRDVHIDVKLAALQSLRKAPCSVQMENKLFNLYVDESASVELRLNALPILLQQCVTKELVSRVVNATNDRVQMNQVGSFAQSYLNALRTSGDPTKDKRLYSSAFLSRKFPSSCHKYSSYQEYSSFNQRKNWGVHVDRSLIFDPRDAFPRQARVNLTIDLWGDEINVLELGVRSQGFHDQYDNMFGPEGYLTDAVLSADRETRAKDNKHPKLAEFQAAYDAKHKPAAGADLTWFVRLFGDEVYYSSLYNVNFVTAYKKFMNVEGMLDAMSQEKSVEFNAYRLPYDYFFTVPVVSGFPLRAAANGSIVVNFASVSKADVKQAPDGNVDVRLKLQPSAASQVSSFYGFYTGPVQNGVHFTRSSHSATAFEVQLLVQNGEMLNAKLNVPKQRQDVFGFETHVHTVINNVHVEEKGDVANRFESTVCTPKKAADLVGFKLCSRLAYPNNTQLPNSPNFPLTGPFDAELYFEKTDPDLQSYELTTSWKANANGRDVVVSFDTPKSKVNRQRKLTVNYVRQKSLNIDYKTPSRHVTAKGALEAAGPDTTAATVSVNVDGKVYEVVGKVKRATAANEYRKYAFDGTVKTADKPTPSGVKGQMEVQPGQKFSLNAEAPNLFEKPLIFNAGYDKSKPGKISAEYEFRSHQGYKRFTGDINYKSASDVDYDFNAEYQLGYEQVHKIRYTHKHKLQSERKQLQLASNSKVTSSKYPALNFAYDFSYSHGPNKVDVKLSTVEGTEPGLTYEQVVNLKPNDYGSTVLLKYPKARVHQTLNAVYRHDAAKGFEATLSHKDETAKQETSVAVVAKLRPSPNPMAYEGDASATVRLPGNVEYKAVALVTKAGAPNVYNTEFSVSWPQNQKAEMKGTLEGTAGNFVRKVTYTFPGWDPLDIVEKVQHSGSTFKIQYSAKKKGADFLTIDSDVNLQEAQKKLLKFRFQLPTQKVDYAFDGSYENLPVSSRVFGSVNKDNKPYVKADVVLPKTYRYDENKAAKAHFTWNLDQPATKMVNFDYKTEKGAPNVVDHQGSLHLKMPNADYKFDLKRRHNEARMTNFTIFKSDAPLMLVSAGHLYRTVNAQSQSGYFDVYFKSFSPMTSRDLSGRVSFETTPQKSKGDVYLADQAKNQRFGLNFDVNRLTTAQQDGYDKTFTLKTEGYDVELKNRYVLLKSGNGLDVNGVATLTSKGAPGPQNYKWSLSRNPTKFDAQLETPSPGFPKFSVKGEKSVDGNKRRMKYDIVFGKETFNIDSNYEAAENYISADLAVKSSVESLKQMNYQMKSDQRKGLDAGFKVDLNNVHKLGSSYTRYTGSNGEEKWGIGFLAKLGTAYDWETSSESTWNQDAGKYVTKNFVRTSAAQKNRYKVDVDLNAKTMQAKVDLENVPGLSGAVTGAAKKLGDNEYEISLSDATGPNKGLVGFKFTAPSQKLRLETPAFKSSYESEYTPTKFGVSANVVPDPAAAAKAYSLKFGLETPDQATRKTNLEVGYPERKLSVSSQRSYQPGVKLDDSLEINPNVGKRGPVKLQYSLVRGGPKANAEFHLTDPNLPEGLHVMAEYARTGNFEDDNADYALSSQFTLKYTADPQKHLVFKKENKRQVVAQRSKVSTSVQVSHPSSNLNHKIFNTYLLEPCAHPSPDCEYAFSFGAQYPSAQKSQEEISLDFRRSEKAFEATVVSGSDKYKLSRKKATGQREYLITKNDKELYEINTELVTKGDPSVGFTLVKKPDDNVLFRAAASLAADDLATVHVYHDENGQLIKDLEGTAKLVHGDSVKLKLYRRPGLTDAINKFVANLPQPQDLTVLPVVQSHVKIGSEISQKLRPFFDALDREDDAIASELKITTGKLSKVVRDGFEDAGEALNFALDSLNSYSSSVSSSVASVTKSYRNAAYDAWKNVPDFTENVMKPLRASLLQAQANYEQLMQSSAKALNDAYTGSKLQDLVGYAVQMYREAGEGSLFDRARRVLAALRRTSPAAEDAGKQLTGFWDSFDKIRRQRLAELVDFWEKSRSSVVNDPDNKELVDFFDAASAKVQWSLQQTTKPAFWLALSRMYYYPPDQFVPTYCKTTPDNAQVCSAFLPLMRNYNSLTDLALALTPEQVVSTYRDLRSEVEDALDSILNSDGGLPGDDDQALVVGQDYLVTFDGQVRYVSTDCSYLLAKDFIDSLFSVQIDYSKSGNSIVVNYGNDKVVMSVDGKVLVNGKNAELPWYTVDANDKVKVSVSRHDDYFTKVRVFNGLSVECNSFSRICTVSLDKRFRGRTNGLFGRNDGETYTDLWLPDQTVAPDFNAYLKAWALTPSCANSQNRPEPASLAPDHVASEACDEFFDEAHSRCNNVETKQFLDFCRRSAKTFVDQQRDVAKHNQSVCLASAAYLTLCPNYDEPPSQCVQCDLLDHKLGLHDSERVSGRPPLNKVDIVFLVDNRECHADLKSYLGQLVQKVESNLKSNGFDVKFGLAGFNGKGALHDTSFYTSTGAVLFSAGGFTSAVSRMNFEDADFPRAPNRNLNVLRYVMEHFSFRPTSRKVLVLMACESCFGLELDYYTLRNDLLSHSYALHYVTKGDISFSQPVNDIVMGFDAKSFILKDATRKSDNRQYLAEPHDSCTLLAQETNGTVFSSHRASDLKILFDVLPKEISRTADGSTCNVCECSTHEQYPRTVCLPCEIPAPTYITDDSGGFFDNPVGTLQKLGG